jgi:imidazolonepropionase-like amidohydrolase
MIMAEKKAVLGRYVDVINGTVIEDGAILVDGKNIIFAGKQADAPLTKEHECFSMEGGTILPGFIDCHAHIFGSEDYMAVPRDRMVLKAAYDMKALLESGFTAARDNVLTYLMDGTTECLKGVRKQFREGAQFIKICATGGVSSMSDGLEDVQFSDEELKAIVEEANRHGSYVAAHCSGLAGAKQALEAGIKTVEHGIHLDEECVEIMKQNDCSLVTTLDISFHVGDMPGLPEYMAVKAKQCAKTNRKSLELVHKAGINVALGTDYSNDEKSHTKYKYIGKEFKAICDGGYTEMESLQIGTINGAKVMRMEDKIGSLEAGKFADIVIVEGNPLEQIEALADADHIRFVMKEGKIYKNTINA